MQEEIDIGGRLRELRIQKSLTQEELADRCELSKGFISQVERNLTSPSISTLVDLLQCLGTDLKEFFSDCSDRQVVFTPEDYFVKEDPKLKNQVSWIVPNAQKNRMEPVRMRIEAGGSTYPDLPHEGEEFGYLLKGQVIIHLGRKSYIAKEGEAFYFTAGENHFLSSDTGAELIWVSSPPSF